MKISDVFQVGAQAQVSIVSGRSKDFSSRRSFSFKAQFLPTLCPLLYMYFGQELDVAIEEGTYSQVIMSWSIDNLLGHPISLTKAVISAPKHQDNSVQYATEKTK